MMQELNPMLSELLDSMAAVCVCICDLPSEQTSGVDPRYFRTFRYIRGSTVRTVLPGCLNC